MIRWWDLDHGAIINGCCGDIEGCLALGLQRHGPHSLPCSAVRIHDTRGRCYETRDRDVDDAVVNEADSEPSVSGHRTVNSICSEEHAVESV